jgi:hypothetical protein
MSDSVALNRLRQKLQAAMAPNAVMRHDPWVDPRPMRDAAKSVAQAFDSIGGAPPAAGLLQAVLAFVRDGQAGNFNQLKYVCYGLTLSIDTQHARLADDDQHFKRLLSAVDDQRGEYRRYRRCYQALLQSYFAFPGPAPDTPQPSAAAGFLGLRAYLSDRLEVVARPKTGRVPGWVLTLKEHDNLLTDTPCDRYTHQLAQGRTELLAEVCAGLGISRDSWVWQEVILAYLREICARSDVTFKRAVDTALDLADGHTELKPSPGTSRLVVSRVVKRYSEAAQHPELPRLRDASVEQIGNPWVKRAAWDAWVQHEPARQMVDSWLKSKLMEDFFTLLSEQTGETTDRRRLQYWLRYVPVITDMWFALGPLARRNRSPEFREVLNRMAGRRPNLDPSLGDGNNAFIMKIGNHYFIEFGAKGNACYYYREDQLPFDPMQASLSIHDLKQLKRQRVSHVPSATWEAEFDRRFRPLMDDVSRVDTYRTQTRQVQQASSFFERPQKLASNEPGRESTTPSIDPPKGSNGEPELSQPAWPSYRRPSASSEAVAKAQPAISPKTGAKSTKGLLSVLSLCDLFGVKHEDLRSKGGSLWVYTDPVKFPALVSDLEAIGFKYKLLRGYWLAGED